jgi:hypothetical protein
VPDGSAAASATKSTPFPPEVFLWFLEEGYDGAHPPGVKLCQTGT